MADDPSLDGTAPQLTAALFLRWYGGKAESFVMARLRACGEDNDQDGVTAWAELLRTLRAIKADTSPPSDDPATDTLYREAAPARRLFNFGGRAA